MDSPSPSPSSVYLDPILTTAATAGSSSERDDPLIPAGDHPVATKRTRTKSGCYSCRGRRIKCGEEKPECKHCTRLGLVCQWTKGPPGAFVPERINPERSLTACRACRTSRSKCSHDRPLCTQCAKKGIACEFPTPRKVRFPGQPLSGSSEGGGRALDEDEGRILDDRQPVLPPESSRQLLSAAIITQHVEAYFTFLYPTSWLGFLHKQTLYDALATNSVPRHLLLSICAVSSNFVSSAAGGIAEDWIHEARHLILDHLEIPSSATLAATLLVVHFEDVRRRRASLFVFLGMASRMAYMLQLNSESSDPALSWGERESRRRMMWACYCVDQFLALDLDPHVSESTVKVVLPCKDENFELQVPCTTPTLSQATEAYFSGGSVDLDALGLSGHNTIMVSIRARVLHFRRNIRLFPRPPWEALSEFDLCLSALETWKATLPPDLFFNPTNIRAHLAASQLSPFLSLHVWARQVVSDMTHIAMPGFVELPSPNPLAGAPEAWLTSTRETCARKAAEIADLFVAVLAEIPSFHSSDPGIAICAFQSTRIQIEWVLLAKGEDRARRRAAAIPRIDATLRILRAMDGLFMSVDHIYDLIVNTLARHGYAPDLDFGPRIATQGSGGPSVPGAKEPWAPSLPVSLRPPESNVRGGDFEEWPEDLQENARWNVLTYGFEASEVDSFLSLYTFANQPFG